MSLKCYPAPARGEPQREGVIDQAKNLSLWSQRIELRWQNPPGIFLHPLSSWLHPSRASMAAACLPKAGSGDSSKFKHNPARRKSKPLKPCGFLALWSFAINSVGTAQHNPAKNSSGAPELHLGKPQPDPSLPASCLLPRLAGSTGHGSNPGSWLKQERIYPFALRQSTQVPVNPVRVHRGSRLSAVPRRHR